MTNAERRAPWHLRVVGVLGGLWSVMGLLSFIFTQVRVEAVMSGFPPEQRAYFESFPFWMNAAWGVGVIGGVAGSVLLLACSRSAFPTLVISLIGATVTSLGGLFLLGGLEIMKAPADLALTLLPVVVAALLTSYARIVTRPAPTPGRPAAVVR